MATPQEIITAIYVGYYNRAPDPGGLNYWIGRLNAGMSISEIASSFSVQPESTAKYPYLANPNVASSATFLNSIYMNLFNRPIDAGGATYWAAQLAGGKPVGQMIQDIISGAQAADLTIINNKIAVGVDFAAKAAEVVNFQYDAAAATAAAEVINGVDATDASVVAGKAETSTYIAGNAGNVGQTFTLTTGADTGALFTGTIHNDIFNAGVDTVLNTTTGTLVNVDTAQNIDSLDGGLGIDTLNITTKGGAVSVPQLTSVEIVNVQGLASFAIDTSAAADVTNLNVTKVVANGTVGATAAATTDISVAVKDAGTIAVDGGKNVNVAATDTSTGDTITVGATTAAAGAVTVASTGKAAAAADSITMGNITVTGGTTVSVVQKVGDASALVAGGAAAVHNQGDVTVTAAATTTSVSVTQDADVNTASTAAVAGATEVASVKFSALAVGDSVTVSGLTFTATKAVSAADVAKAFANLAVDAPTPTAIGGVGMASGDTQGSGISANGTFTGSLLANWTSGAAAADTVVFTGKANVTMTDLSVSAKATVTTTTQGVLAVEAKNVLGVTAGIVQITGGAALKTVTVDGYDTSTGGNGIVGGTNTALDTISLSNGKSFEIDSAADTLALTTNKVNGIVDVQAGTTVINANVTSGATDAVSFQSASATTLNIAGTGSVGGTTAGGNLSAATAINTSAMTAGKATFTIADGTKTTYTGGAGVDTVDVSNANVAITKAIDLGAGDDKLTLNVTASTVAVPTATLNGGAGTDTIVMDAASAAALSVNGDFAGKIEGFEKLSITGGAAVATTVNMANMDGIKYVVSDNSTAVAAPATKEVFTIDFGASGTITGPDTIAFNGNTTTLVGGESATQIALKVAAGTFTNWDVTNVSGSVVTFTAKVAGVTTDVVKTDFTFTDVDATTATGVVTKTVDGDGAGTFEAFTIDFSTSGAIEDADQVVFDGTTITLATGDTAANIATKVGAGAYANWSASVAGNVVTFTQTTTDANQTDANLGDFTFINVKTASTGPDSGAVNVTTQGAAIGAGVAALTIDKMANDGTLELTSGGAGAIVKMADASGTTDSFHLATTLTGNTNFGTVTVSGVEALTLHAMDTTTATINTATLTIADDKATSLTIDGNSHVALTLDATTKLLATVDAHALTGNLTYSANGYVAMTITGGAGNDVLKASVLVGAVAGKADVINGGAGNDTIYAGSNGAQLTGGDGNDTFVLTATSATDGTKEVNTFSTITDFHAGDVLQLQSFQGAATVDAKAFTHLAANLDAGTAVFADFVNQAILEAGQDSAVWFNYKGDAYVVVDSATDTGAFVDGQDMVVKLTGVNGDNLSWNSDFATVALV